MSKYKKKRKWFWLFLLGLFIFILLFFFGYSYVVKRNNLLREKSRLIEINSYYSDYVKTNKDAMIYRLDSDEMVEIGLIKEGYNLVLDNDVDGSGYFKIKSLNDMYYIYYKDVMESSLVDGNNRYKNYIPWNINIKTKDGVIFYDDDNMVIDINDSFTFPVIIKEEDRYGIEFDNRLLYIDSDDVLEVYDSHNTDLSNTDGIAVLNYHFFYDGDDINDTNECRQSICLSIQNLESHINYIKDNNIFTPTMKELEMYIDKEIQLPESVVITIDDGWRAKLGSEVLSNNKINATVFLMSNYYEPYDFENEYIEVHSHGHDLHNRGVCSGGAGGAIRCLEKSKLLDDLAASRKKLNNTRYFCYPFYEYNDYSIEVLKEAGFTMAFAGYRYNKPKVVPGDNKFKLPRYVIDINTSVDDLRGFIK